VAGAEGVRHVLIHLGEEDCMRTYAQVSGAVFSLIALGQLARAVLAVPVQVATMTIPVWCSYAAFLFIGALAIWAFRSLKTAA